MKTFVNARTGKRINRKAPSDEEYIYTGKTLLIEADKEGIITYAYRRFLEVSGYTKEELVGVSHDIYIHPNMPNMIFKDACEMVASDKVWSGYLQNISKQGIAFWLEVMMQPKKDEAGAVIGYMSTMRKPSSLNIEEVIDEYERLSQKKDKEQRSRYCGEVYMG